MRIRIKGGEVLDPATFRFKSKNTPFTGFNVTGSTLSTLVNGKVVYQRETEKQREI